MFYHFIQFKNPLILFYYFILFLIHKHASRGMVGSGWIDWKMRPNWLKSFCLGLFGLGKFLRTNQTNSIKLSLVHVWSWGWHILIYFKINIVTIKIRKEIRSADCSIQQSHPSAQYPHLLLTNTNKHPTLLLPLHCHQVCHTTKTTHLLDAPDRKPETGASQVPHTQHQPACNLTKQLSNAALCF